jgi:uncharacterized protein YegL
MAEERVTERRTVEPGQIVMPFYLVCDVSVSMTHDMPALNDGIQRLSRTIVAEPAVCDVARVGILTFSDIGKVVMPLAQMGQAAIPTLSVEGGTNYGAAFRELAQTIAADTKDLKAQGLQVYRPCAFFLTDGEPNDRDWHQTFVSTLTYDASTKTGMKGHPVFVPFGFRDAPEDVLRKLAYPLEKGKWYHSRNTNIEDTIKGILHIILQTVIKSGMSAGSGQPAHLQQAPSPGSQIAYGDSETFM